MASSAAEAAGRVADDHDGWASDGEADMEMEAGGEAHGRDAGADDVDDAYSLVSVTSVLVAAMWVGACVAVDLANLRSPARYGASVL